MAIHHRGADLLHGIFEAGERTDITAELIFRRVFERIASQNERMSIKFDAADFNLNRIRTLMKGEIISPSLDISELMIAKAILFCVESGQVSCAEEAFEIIRTVRQEIDWCDSMTDQVDR
jgi:cell division GTPase FtsZ